MGIPKFFRYMSERYPCLSELVREDQIPEFDNLYLDMNGIIHPCSHPDDGNVHFRISEEAIFRAIFNYIDKLFFLIKPRKLFFMAVDGVAPRAKMNQQRSRRFRSAKEAETLEKNAMNRGEKLPETARFDSNCITPGTEFMVRLQAALKYFVKLKMSTNPLWQRCRIILSGHETPGEGEHKIMEYIRYLKCQDDYDVNTRHCLYGLDADLIVLGLCTHEMHFSLLREEVSFGKKAKKISVEETRFFLLHLNLLREYLELEFGQLRRIEGKEFNINKIIDDWILMGFLVGNDFIPHLPHLHINSNAMPLLYDIYKIVWPKMDGYLNNNGKLNLANLELFMEKLGEKDLEMFEDIAADIKYLEGKRGQSGIPEAFDFNVDEMSDTDIDADLAKMIEESNKMYGSDDLSDEDAILEKEFKAHKRDYYIQKLNYEEMTPEVLAEQTQCYITALQWILFYYYRGVSSWGWFYPHHYAPFVSDLKNFKHLQFNFDIGKPFFPFEQLLAVLPAASKSLLPEAYRDLMISSQSEIIEYYPTDFKTDLNGKKQDWEAVVLIPFIDEEKLLKAMNTCFPYLLPEEKGRNIHGPMLQYDHTDTSQGECSGVFSFKKIDKVYCKETEVWRDQVRVSDQYLESQAAKWPEKTCHLPGFPTMKYLNYTGKLQRARVKVFEQPSRNDTMILYPKIKEFGEMETVAKEYLEKVVFIGWPHLIKAKISAVLTEKQKATADAIESINPKLFETLLRHIDEHAYNRMGIKFCETSVLVHVNTLKSVEYVVGGNGKVLPTSVWSTTEISYPLQGVVENLQVEKETAAEQNVEDFFPVGTSVFMLSSPYFGCEGKVLDPQLVYTCGRIQVNITVIPEPQLAEAKVIQAEAEHNYYNSYELAQRSGLSANIIARITGSIFVVRGDVRDMLPENTPKSNIGLNLKSKKTDQQVAGFVRKRGNTWEYSQKTLQLIHAYYEKFPEVFNLLASHSGGSDDYFETALFPPNESEKSLSDIVAWLKQQSHWNAERVPCGTSWVESEAVEAIKRAVVDLKTLPVKCVKLQVKPHLLLKHGFNIPLAFRSKSKIRLFDRVVVARKTYQVPIGYKGTVVAIHPMSDPNPVRIECVKQVETFIEVLFDKDLPDIGDENDAELKRVARVAQTSVIVVYQPLEQVIVPVDKPIANRSREANSLDQRGSLENKRIANSDSTKQMDSNRNGFLGNFVEPPKILERHVDSVNLKDERPKRQQDSVPKYTSSGNRNKVPSQNFIAPPNGKQPMNERNVATRIFQQSTNSQPNSIRTVAANPQPSVADLNRNIHDLKLQNMSDSAKSTEALRLLLGMTSSSGVTMPPPVQQSNPPTKIQNIPLHPPMNISLPKPPPNWTKDATKKTVVVQNKNTVADQLIQPLIHGMPSNAPQFGQPIRVPPSPLAQPSLHDFINPPMPHVDRRQMMTQPVYNQSFRHDNQNHPSRETRVNNISSGGQSAFIPLQAMRSMRKNEQPRPDKSFAANQLDQNNTQKSEKAEPNSQNEPGTSTQAMNQQAERNKTRQPVPPRIRKPKIAANFNFNAS